MYVNFVISYFLVYFYYVMMLFLCFVRCKQNNLRTIIVDFCGVGTISYVTNWNIAELIGPFTLGVKLIK